MKTYTVTKREGELLGPVDWNYNFLTHFDGYCGDSKEQYCKEHVDRLRQLADGSEWEATTDGGWPRCGWGQVIAVGMYDGWPHWFPVPSVAIMGPLGMEWSSFSNITSIRKPATTKKPEEPK